MDNEGTHPLGGTARSAVRGEHSGVAGSWRWFRRPAPTAVAVVLAIALPALAIGLYGAMGNPGVLVPGEGVAMAIAVEGREDAPPMRDPLLVHLARNPRDGRGWVLLARIEFDGDRFAAAAEAYRKALEASPKVARDPGVWCEYADALAMAQGGVLAGRPREIIERALALDPRHGRALEMGGGAAFEAGDYDSAARQWRQLLAQMPEGTPARRELELAAAKAERRGAGSTQASGRSVQPRMR